MTRHDDRVTLRHMLDYAQIARRLIAGRTRQDLDADEMFHLALTRAVEVIGEAAARVSDATREAHPNIPWSQITGTRNRLIHSYDRVNFDILWRIVSEELGPLIAQLESILSREPETGP
jgi:uncharacterized protein with HEPN domain